jgi:hypothetical protein
MDTLKLIKENAATGKQNLYTDTMEHLLEKLLVFEYNDGTLQKANPVVTLSEKYRQYVGE